MHTQQLWIWIVDAYYFVGSEKLKKKCLPPIHMCISAEPSAMRLKTLLGVITANALGLEKHKTHKINIHKLSRYTVINTILYPMSDAV